MSSSMKELVEYMAKAVVNDPDSVIVREIEGSSATIFELSVTPEDMGRVIGKSGRVINAIRSLLQVAAAKQGERVSLELLESDDVSKYQSLIGAMQWAITLGWIDITTSVMTLSGFRTAPRQGGEPSRGWR